MPKCRIKAPFCQIEQSLAIQGLGEDVLYTSRPSVDHCRSGLLFSVELSTSAT
jgi:hypothetical protein